MFEENSSKIVFLLSIISSVSLAALIIILPTAHFSMQKRLTTIISIANDCKLESKNLWRDLNSRQSFNIERFRRQTNNKQREKENNIINNVCCSCKQGKPGLPGKEGKPGRQGKDGINGQRGWTGRSGKYIETPNDATGADSCQKCYPGIPGPPGPSGLKGLPGLAGEPGKHGTNGRSSKNGLTGSAGPRGEPGFPGQKGPQGDPGRVLNGAPPGRPGSIGLTGPRGPPGRSGKDGEWGMPGDKGMRGLMGLRGEFGVVGMPGPHGAVGEPGQPGGCWHCKQDIPYQQPSTTLKTNYYSPTASLQLYPSTQKIILKEEYNLMKETTEIPSLLFKPIKEENKAFGQIQITKIGSSAPSIPLQMFPPGYEKEEPKKFQKNGPIQLATFFGYGIGGNYRGSEDNQQKQKIKFGREEEEENIEKEEFIVDVTNKQKEENYDNKAVLV